MRVSSSARVGGFFDGDGLGCLDDAEVVSPAVLPDMLVGIAELALVIGRKFGKQGDDAAAYSWPAPEDDQGDGNVIRRT